MAGLAGVDLIFLISGAYWDNFRLFSIHFLLILVCLKAALEPLPAAASPALEA